MIRIARISISLYLVSILLGCASGKTFKSVDYPEYNHKKSEALNIMRAARADSGLSDVPKERIDRYRGPYNWTNAVGNAGLAIPAYDLLMDQASAMDLGMGALFFLSSSGFVPAKDNRVIAWVPDSVVQTDPGQWPFYPAAKLLHQNMQAALPEGFTVTEGTDDKGFITWTATSVEGQTAFSYTLTGGGEQTMYSTVRPDDSEPSYFFSGGVNIEFSFDNIDSLGGIDGLRAVLTKVSEISPDWMYIYLAPGKGFTHIPAILHKGELLYFERPAS